MATIQTTIIRAAAQHPDWSAEDHARHLKRDALDLWPSERDMLTTSPTRFIVDRVAEKLRNPYIISFIVGARMMPREAV